MPTDLGQQIDKFANKASKEAIAEAIENVRIKLIERGEEAIRRSLLQAAATSMGMGNQEFFKTFQDPKHGQSSSMSIYDAIRNDVGAFKTRVTLIDTGYRQELLWQTSNYADITKLNPFFPYYEFGGKGGAAYRAEDINTYKPHKSGGVFYYAPEHRRSTRRPGERGLILPLKAVQTTERRRVKAFGIVDTPKLDIYKHAHSEIRRKMRHYIYNGIKVRVFGNQWVRIGGLGGSL